MLKNFDLRWYPRPGADRGDGGERLSGRLRTRAPSSRGSTTRRASMAWKSSMPEPRADGTRVLANGGRVLNVCAIGKSVAEAQAKAYAAIAKIDWPEGFCRRDIGRLAIEREKRVNDAPPISRCHVRPRRPLPRICVALDRHLGRQDVRALRRRRPAAPPHPRLRANQCDVAQRGARPRETFHARAARTCPDTAGPMRRNPAPATHLTTSARWRM